MTQQFLIHQAVTACHLPIDRLLNRILACYENGAEDELHTARAAYRREIKMLLALGEFLFPDTWKAAEEELFQGRPFITTPSKIAMEHHAEVRELTAEGISRAKGGAA